MSANFPAAVKAEIAELEADLRDNPDPRVRKLKRLRDTLAEYEPAPAAVKQSDFDLDLAPALRIEAGPGRGKSALMMQVVSKLLENGTTHRKVLLDELVANGIMGKEKNPMQALAIFLSSHKDVFAFDGNGNWMLRKEEARQ